LYSALKPEDTEALMASG